MEKSLSSSHNEVPQSDIEIVGYAGEIVKSELEKAEGNEQRAEIVGKIGEKLSQEGVLVVDLKVENDDNDLPRGKITGRTREEVFTDRKNIYRRYKGIPISLRRA